MLYIEAESIASSSTLKIPSYEKDDLHRDYCGEPKYTKDTC